MYIPVLQNVAESYLNTASGKGMCMCLVLRYSSGYIAIVIFTDVRLSVKQNDKAKYSHYTVKCENGTPT